MTPRHRESDQGRTGGRSPSRARVWCAGRRSRPSQRTTPAAKSKSPTPGIAARRGRNIARLAAARNLLT